MFETLQLRWRDKQKAPAVKKVPGVCQPEVYLEHFDSSRFQPGYPSDASENVSSSGSKVKQVPWKFTRRSAGGRELGFVCIWNGYRALHQGIEQSRKQEPGVRNRHGVQALAITITFRKQRRRRQICRRMSCVNLCVLCIHHSLLGGQFCFIKYIKLNESSFIPFLAHIPSLSLQVSYERQENLQFEIISRRK